MFNIKAFFLLVSILILNVGFSAAGDGAVQVSSLNVSTATKSTLQDDVNEKQMIAEKTYFSYLKGIIQKTPGNDLEYLMSPEELKTFLSEVDYQLAYYEADPKRSGKDTVQDLRSVMSELKFNLYDLKANIRLCDDLSGLDDLARIYEMPQIIKSGTAPLSERFSVLMKKACQQRNNVIQVYDIGFGLAAQAFAKKSLKK